MSKSATRPAVDLRAIADAFLLHGCFIEGAPYGSGHINDTFVAIEPFQRHSP